MCAHVKCAEIKLIMRGLFLTFAETARARRGETENEKRGGKKEGSGIRHLNNSASNNRHTVCTVHYRSQSF